MRDDPALLQGMSLIHWAAVLDRADLVELLLSNGATVSAKNTKVRFATLSVVPT
jgi:ankyrin repeat protein